MMGGRNTILAHILRILNGLLYIFHGVHVRVDTVGELILNSQRAEALHQYMEALRG
jgi:hypothetical protein